MSYLRSVRFVLLGCLVLSAAVVRAAEFPLNLLFSREDVPRIRANAELPLFQEYWQSLQEADFAQDNNYLREAFLYALTGDETRGQNARQGMLAELERKRWDMFVNARGETLGFLRAGRTAAWMSLGYDWIYPLLSPTEREAILDQIVEKGCVPIYRSLYGMRHPETVERWQFDPEFTDHYEVPDMSRWPVILGHNNFRAVASGGFALALFAVEDRDERWDTWKEMLLDSYDRAATLYQPDGSYDEGIAYANYANTYLVYLIEVMQRKLGLELFDKINFEGLADSNLASAFPDVIHPSGSVNFGDAGQSLNTSNLFWIARHARDGVTQYQGLHYATQHDLFSLVHYDPSVQPVAPDESGYFAHLDIEWITARTGYALEDLVVAMRSGPPANHEHADRNSIILKYGGEVLLNDPWRPTYDPASPAWLLRTAEAHNTVLIDDQGHPYHDGSEGTNASQAAAKTVRAGERPGMVFWASDATPAYALGDPDVAAVTRSVFLFRELPFILVLDKVQKTSTPSQIGARWFVQNSDGAGAVTTDGLTFVNHRPGASFHATIASNVPVEVRADQLPLDASFGVFPYAEVRSSEKTTDALFLLAGCPVLADAPTPTVELRQEGETWWVTVSTATQRLELKVIDEGTLPEVEVLSLR